MVFKSMVQEEREPSQNRKEWSYEVILKTLIDCTIDSG